MKKKIYSILLCFFCAVLLCGCTTNVEYGFEYTPNDDGSYGITQSVGTTIDTSSILLAGKSIDEYVQFFKDLSGNVMSAFKSKFSTNLQALSVGEDQADALAKIKSLTGQDWTVSELSAYVSKNVEDLQFDSSLTNQDILVDKGYIYIVARQKFGTILAYNAFYGVVYNQYEDKENSTVIDETFYKKNVTTQNTPFHNLTEDKLKEMSNTDLLKQIVTKVEDFFGGSFNLENRDLTYTFSFATPQKHFYADSQTMYTSTNGNSVYLWNFSSQDIKNGGDKITFYTVSYRSVPWYAVAIFATIILGAVLFVVASVKNKYHKQKGIYSGANAPGENQ